MKWCELRARDTIVAIEEDHEAYVFVMLDDWMGLDLQTGNIMSVRSDNNDMEGWEVFRPER